MGLRDKKGFSLIELLTVLGIIAFLAAVSFLTLSGSRRQSSFDQAKVRISALLSDAQNRSINEEGGSAWGVRFDNATSGAFYALFSGTYSSSTEKGHYALPTDVQYATTSIPSGSFREIMFKKITGAASSSGSIAIQMAAIPSTSSTISISASGIVSY